MKRVDELQDKFPEVPRAVIIKADILREGIRFNPLALEIGKWAVPEFLPWDRDVHKDYKAIENELMNEDWAWLPHSMTFKEEGITAKVIYDFIRHHTSPYELREEEGSFWLSCEEEPLVEVTFEKRPEWLSSRMEDGRRMASVLVPSSPDNLLGFPIRFCAYYQPEDTCRFCCLNPTGKNIAKGDGHHDVIMSGEAAALCLAAALQKTALRHVTLTGGALRNQGREAEIYAQVAESLAAVRGERGGNLTLKVMSTAFDDTEQERLREAGVDEVCFNMEVWGEELWPEVVPGKDRTIGRTAWMERLVKAGNRFGRGRAMTQFVVGVEMVSGRFTQYTDGMSSVLEGIEWCAQNGIQPDTSTWFNTPGSLYEQREVPPTEYFLSIALERHKILEKHGMYFPADALPNYSAACHHCGYLSPDSDFQWLLGSGKTRG
jgi:hypothetical protein